MILRGRFPVGVKIEFEQGSGSLESGQFHARDIIPRYASSQQNALWLAKSPNANKIFSFVVFPSWPRLLSVTELLLC